MARLGLRVTTTRASQASRLLRRARLHDRRRSVLRERATVTFPLRERPGVALVRDLEGEVVEADFTERVGGRWDPYEEIEARLDGTVDDALLEQLPNHWERYGHVLVLRFLRGEWTPGEKRVVAAAYAEVLGTDVVLEDVGGVAGELREPVVERLVGEASSETTHVENGLRFTFDPARVMFASGNLDERTRMGTLAAQGETVVDLFAGIGYFSVPLAARAGAARVIACELNPVAHGYLVRNAAQNRVADKVEARLGDCRTVAPRGAADRVLMGYVWTTHEFLPTAFAALKPEGGTIHYHETCPEELLPTRPWARVQSAAAEAERTVKLSQYRYVKSYAPGVGHVVLDVRVG